MTSEQDARGFGAAVPKPGPPSAPKPGPPSSAAPSVGAPGSAAASSDTAAEEQVAAVLAHLDDLAQRPVAEHVAAYEAVHRTLQDTLSAVDGT